MNHTPGPWHLNPFGFIHSAYEEGTIIAEAPSSTFANSRSHWDANANFIVRACNAHDDLVAALGDLIEEVEILCEYRRDQNNPDTETEEKCAAARAALAKAKGESS